MVRQRPRTHVRLTPEADVLLAELEAASRLKAATIVEVALRAFQKLTNPTTLYPTLAADPQPPPAGLLRPCVHGFLACHICEPPHDP